MMPGILNEFLSPDLDLFEIKRVAGLVTTNNNNLVNRIREVQVSDTRPNVSLGTGGQQAML